MRQVWIPRAGSPDVLEVREAPDPTPGPGEVRVAVQAAGVNFADLMARMGVYPDAPSLPFVPGYEIAGVIDAVGAGVPETRLGEPVIALTRFGGYSSSVLLTADRAVRRPAGMDAPTGASLPVNGLTAWMLLEVFGRVREGDRVLIHSLGGGVGLLALDLARRRGAWVAGTASPAKHAMLRERGADLVIDSRGEDLEAAFAGQPGLDLILDPVGGASWAAGLRLLRPGGQLGCFGFSAQATGSTRSVLSSARAALAVPWLKINPISLMNANLGVYGVNMGRLWGEAPRVSAWLGELLALWEAGALRPHVHGAWNFDEAAAAHACLHDRANVGKVVLLP